jgi:hypothetical protein
MFTEFFRPADFNSKRITETTFVIEKKLTEKISLFTEYVGDYPEGTIPASSLTLEGCIISLPINRWTSISQLG